MAKKPNSCQFAARTSDTKYMGSGMCVEELHRLPIHALPHSTNRKRKKQRPYTNRRNVFHRLPHFIHFVWHLGGKRKRWAFRPNGNHPLWRSEYFATINFAQDRIRILVLDSPENQIFIRFWPSSLFFSCNELGQSASGISHRNERGKQKPAGNREK